MTGPWKSWGTRRRAASGVVIVVALAVLTGVLLQPRSEPPPSSSASPEASGTATPTEAAWSAVDLPEIPVVADLSASGQDEAGIRPDATFALASRTGEGAAALASRLVVTPVLQLAVTGVGDGSTAILTPAAPLQPGAVYRFALNAADGSLAGSWAFRVRSPLHVLSTIPADAGTNVPVSTGIEFTFDQEGAANIGPYFSISPSVTGRFERHGRTQVFVPDRLQPATLYTATVRAGLPRTGTDLALESDVVLRFETAGTATATLPYRFGREVVETSPAEAPVMALDPSLPEGSPVPTTVDVVVYRLPDETAATSVLAAFLAAPRWCQFSYPTIPTDGLPVVARFTASLESSNFPLAGGSPFRLFRFPDPLAVGWYVVDVPGPRRADAFLQVTPVSAWVSVLTDKTVLWANDVEKATPIQGATVAVRGSAPFATTDARGVAIAATPVALIPPAESGGKTASGTAPLLVVRSARGTVLVPFEVPFDWSVYRGEWWERWSSADSTFWSLLHTDRNIYRATDRIEAWGYLRGRDNGLVPSSVEIQLVQGNDARSPAAVPIASVRATPSATGAYTATLPIVRVPYAWYGVRAVVDGRVVSVRYVSVDVIRKPTFQLALEPDHLAVIAGSSVRWTAKASFFDGSPAPSLPLRLYQGNGEELVLGPTDATGTASITLPTPTSDLEETATWEAWDTWRNSVMPAGPEEGVTSADAAVLVFPSSDHVAATGTLRSGRLTVNGSVHQVDLGRIARELAAGTWNDDPSGAPIGGRSVRVEVTELVPVRKQVGTYYDFIEKVVLPQYEYETQRKALRTLTLASADDGRFSFAMDVPVAGHAYEVALSTIDAAGRTDLRKIVVGEVPNVYFRPGTEFQTPTGQDPSQVDYAVGDRLAWRMISRVNEDAIPLPSGGTNRYLYIVAQRGLVDVSTSTAPAFSRTFTASDAPGVFVMGVRFTGSAYAPKAASWADFKRSTRALNVTISTDQPRYRPGGEMALTVRTTNAAGRPQSAEVIVQVVDEKLFAMGGAWAPETLVELYARVDSGVVRLTSTHQLPSSAGGEGEGGDTTGGGRSEFRDTLASRSVTTGPDGLATTTVKLSDDLTSWHILASGVTARLETGVGEKIVPVGLPLFADVTLADGYLVTDRPTIRLRAYGSSLQAGDPVEFTVSAPSLGVAPTVLRTAAFTNLSFELPQLTLGHHDLRVAVSAPTRLDAAGQPLQDSLIRPIEVLASRVTKAETWYGTVGDALPAIDPADPATYTFTDAGRGRYLQLLREAVEPTGLRLDRALAQDLARDLLIREFASDPGTMPGGSVDLTRYTIGNVDAGNGTVRSGAALVPAASVDPWLAARLAMLDPTGPAAGPLLDPLQTVLNDPATLRDLRIATLAGLAALGRPVDADLRDALTQTDLTVDERIDLALGFLAGGDHATALGLERDLLRDHGQRLGGWVRLRVGTAQDESIDATARLAVLAAGLGDPLAPAMIDYVAANPSRETSNVLELVAASGLVLERTAAATASFAYVLDGKRTQVTVGAGETVSLLLIGTQRSSFRLEPVSGKVGLVVSWRSPASTATLPRDPALQLSRTLPSTSLPPDQIVTVDLTATLTPAALRSWCYEVVEQAPSGLAPLDTSWSDEQGLIWPTRVVGQEVRFCVPYAGVSGATAHLRYVARVVNAGTFTWEPAIMQLDVASDLVVTSVAGTVTIRPQ